MSSPKNPPHKSKSDLMIISPREKSLLVNTYSKESAFANGARKNMSPEETIKFTIRQRLYLHEIFGFNKPVKVTKSNEDDKDLENTLFSELKGFFGDEAWLKDALAFLFNHSPKSMLTRTQVLTNLREFIVDEKRVEDYILYLKMAYFGEIEIGMVEFATRHSRRRDRNSDNVKDIPKIEEKEKLINVTTLSRSNPVPKSLISSKDDSGSSDSSSKPKRTKRLSEYHNKTEGSKEDKSGKTRMRTGSLNLITAEEKSEGEKKPMRKSQSLEKKDIIITQQEPRRSKRAPSRENSHNPLAEKLDIIHRTLSAFSWETDEKNLFYQEEIGKGAYGLVFKARYRGKDIAAKRYACESNELDAVVHILREISLLSSLSHKNIIKFMGACLGSNVCVLMSCCENGDLTSYLNKSVYCSWKTKLKYTLEIASGLQYLHSAEIYHRDLKASNILVTGKDTLKICDFGSAQRFHEKDLVSNDTNVGTINWCAPEILFNGEPFTCAADVYSFGMVCYEVVTKGKIPYTQLNPLQTIRAIEEGEKPNVDITLEQDYKDFMVRCWEREKGKRPLLDSIIIILNNLLVSAEQKQEVKSQK